MSAGRAVDADVPDWQPLERAFRIVGLPVACCGEFMWMYRQGSLEFYKHVVTRRYMALRQDGACYVLVPDRLVELPFVLVYERVTGNFHCPADWRSS